MTNEEISLRHYVDQRFSDFERLVTTALVAAEKLVTLSFSASEKAVDKADHAQELRNTVANEFRDSLGDLSQLMWTIKEGKATVDSLRAEHIALINSLDKRLTEYIATKAGETTGRVSLRTLIFSVMGTIATTTIAVTAIFNAFK